MQEQRGKDVTCYTYDAADRLMYGDSPPHVEAFSYDKRGNLLSITADGASAQTFEFDSANRLAMAHYVRGEGQSRYLYNGIGRRVARVETNSTGEENTTRYVRDLSRRGRNLLQESGASAGAGPFCGTM